METIKKMNLSAIEDRLSMSEMQEIQAGSMSFGCAAGIVACAFAFGGLVTCTAGGAALFFAAGGWIIGPSVAALGCK